MKQFEQTSHSQSRQKPLKASVIMAVYNGIGFLEPQLESLRKQSRPADEVLIFDDGSTDGSIELIENYIEQHQLQDTWKLTCNRPNKGVERNFIEGAAMSHGNVIFYCDQDDVWVPAKIERMMAGFESYPDMLACYSQVDEIDQNDQPLHYALSTMTDAKNKGGLYSHIAPAAAVRYMRSAGHRIALRRELFDKLSALILEKKLTHDLPVGLSAGLMNGYYLCDEVLVHRRLHTDNVSNPHFSLKERVSDSAYQKKSLNLKIRHLNAVYEAFQEDMSAEDAAILKDAIATWEKSLQDLEEGKKVSLFKTMFHSNAMINPKILVNDFLCALWAGKAQA